MSTILTSNELVRVFKYKGKTLDDIDPTSPPEQILKFYAGQYPELNNASVGTPEFKGDNMIFSISTSIGTKG